MYYETRKYRADEITCLLLECDYFRDALYAYVEDMDDSKFINSLEKLIDSKIEKIVRDIREYRKT